MYVLTRRLHRLCIFHVEPDMNSYAIQSCWVSSFMDNTSKNPAPILSFGEA